MVLLWWQLESPVAAVVMLLLFCVEIPVSVFSFSLVCFGLLFLVFFLSLVCLCLCFILFFSFYSLVVVVLLEAGRQQAAVAAIFFFFPVQRRKPLFLLLSFCFDCSSSCLYLILSLFLWSSQNVPMVKLSRSVFRSLWFSKSPRSLCFF